MSIDNQSNKIIISDHLVADQIQQLFEEYVNPVIGSLELSAENMHPRRILGNYITYLVADGNDTHSVMVNKGKSPYAIQCDCTTYNHSGKCPHIAKVLISAKNQCFQEENFKKIEVLRREEHNKKIEADIARAAKLSFHRIITPAAISKNPVSPNRTIIVIVCALLGMFFAIAMITLIHAIKARVNDVETIESNSSIPVTLHTPFLKTPEQKRNHFLKSVQNLSIKDLIYDENILCFSSLKDDEGKAFHIVNMAEALGSQGRKVLILDAEGSLSTMGNVHELPQKTKLSNVDYLQPNVAACMRKPLDVLQEEIHNYLDHYDLVLINNENLTNGILTNAWMSSSHCNFMMMDTRNTPKKAIMHYNLMCDEYKFSKAHFVLNRYGYNPNVMVESIQKIKSMFHKPVQTSWL